MIRKRFLVVFIGAFFLAGCGGLPVSETPSPDPITVAQRGGSALTPEGGTGEDPADPDATATEPLSLIEMATQTALASLTQEEGNPSPTPSENDGETATDAGQANSTAANTSAPTTANTSAPSATTGSQQQPSATPQPSNTNPPAPSNTPVPQNTATTAPSNTPAPTAINTTAATTSNCSPGSDSAFENEVVSLINAERSKEGLSPLTKQSQLTAAARIHSQDMACNDFFSHTSPTTGSPFDRIAAQGYTYSFAGENIAAGYGTAAAVVEGWMNSAGHRANILNENFTQIGIGYAYTASSTYGTYITAVFAKP